MEKNLTIFHIALREESTGQFGQLRRTERLWSIAQTEGRGGIPHQPALTAQAFEIVPLFRYDLDPAGVESESSLVQLPVATNDSQSTTHALEHAQN
jgi:hypothetical protein